MTENTYNPPKINSKAFKTLATLFIIGALLTAIAFLHPAIFTAFLNFFWIMMLIIVAVFLVLGFLVIVGMKSEVGSFLDVVLEGSLTILDAINILKKLYERFITLLKDFIYFITPIIAIWIAIIIYIGLIILYKSVGMENDVTLLTIVLTVALVVAVGILNKPVENVTLITWADSVRLRFKGYFADAFEVVIFLFFLTMDLKNLFFLPDNLKVPINAFIGNYDLMLRGTNYSHQIMVTIYLVAFSILFEIIRNLIRLIAVATKHYRQADVEISKIQRMKSAIRMSFSESKDYLVKFITFTTVLILVFLFFPRLKLFAMFITSITNLMLDLLMNERLFFRKGTDLISRILNKLFNV